MAAPLGSVTVGQFRLDVGGDGGTLISPARAAPATEPGELARALEQKPRPAGRVVGEAVERASVATGRAEEALALLGDLAAGRVEAREVSARVDLMLEALDGLDREGRWKEARDLARALSGALALLFRWVELVRSLHVVSEAAARLGDSSALAWSEHELGTLHLAAGHLGEANRRLGEAERLRSEIGDNAGLAATRHNLQVLCSQLRAQLDRRGPSPRGRLVLIAAGAAIALLALGGVAGAWIDKGGDGPPPSGKVGLVVTTTGPGSVTSSPAGIDCGQDCEAQFSANSGVVLAASPDNETSTFTGWSGAGCRGIGECTPVLVSGAIVRARFAAKAPGTATLNVDPAPVNGRVTSNPAGIDCPPTCAKQFLKPVDVTLIAAPADGFALDAFDRDCSGTQCTLTMSEDRTVKASFVPTVVLTIRISGTGTVTVGPGGPQCASSCRQRVKAGREVLLTGADNLTGWGGACASSKASTSCTLTPTADTSLTAAFGAPPAGDGTTTDGTSTTPTTTAPP